MTIPMALGCIMLLAPIAIMIATVRLQAGWHGALILSLILIAALIGTAWMMLGVALITGALP